MNCPVFIHIKQTLHYIVGWWSSHTVTIVCKFARADSALVVIGEWSSYRGGRLNRFDCKYF